MTQGRFGLPKNVLFFSSIPFFLRKKSHEHDENGLVVIKKKEKREKEREKTRQGFDDCLDEFYPSFDSQKAAIKKRIHRLRLRLLIDPLCYLVVGGVYPLRSAIALVGLFTKIYYRMDGFVGWLVDLSKGWIWIRGPCCCRGGLRWRRRRRRRRRACRSNAGRPRAGRR